MDVIFVRPPNMRRIFQRQGDFVDYGRMTPDSLLVLTSYLNRNGFHCRILDLCVDSGLLEIPAPQELPRIVEAMAQVVCEAIASGHPKILGFTSLSNGDAWTSVLVAEAVKKYYPSPPVVMGGYFPTCNGQEILATCSAIDAVVVGEGEYPLRQILERMREKLDPFSGEVAGLLYRDRGQVVGTGHAPAFDLSDAQPLDFSLLANPSAYTALGYHTSRNCPWRCNYCLEAQMGTRYRTKPIQVIRQDIQNFQAVNRSFVMMVTDPIMAVSDERAGSLCELFGELGVKYIFESRVDIFPSRLIAAAASSGCVSMYFGMESASFDTLLRMNKLRPPDFNQYEKYLECASELMKACAENAVIANVGAMVGYPGDTPEDLTVTLDFMRRLRSIYTSSMAPARSRGGFIVNPFQVTVPRQSPLWRARHYYVRKGLRLMDDELFGDCNVRDASTTLDRKQIESYVQELGAVSAWPSDVDPALARIVLGNSSATATLLDVECRIQKRIEVKAPPPRVWPALTDYREFGEWFRVKLEGPFVPGQVSLGHLTYPGYEHIKWEAVVQKMEPERLFSFTWHPFSIDPQVDYSQETPTLVEFRLEPSALGTLLVLTESGFDQLPSARRAEAYRGMEAGWTQQMANIETYVACRPREPLPIQSTAD